MIEQSVPKNTQPKKGGIGLDIVKLLGDTALTAIGAGDVISDESYTNKGFATASKITGGLAQMGANIVSGGITSMLVPKAKYGMGFRNNLVNKPSSKTIKGKPHSLGGKNIRNSFGEIINVEGGEEYITAPGLEYIASNKLNDINGKSFAENARDIEKKFKGNDVITKQAKALKLKQLTDRNTFVRKAAGLDNPNYAFGGIDLIRNPNLSQMGFTKQGFGLDTIGKQTKSFKDISLIPQQPTKDVNTNVYKTNTLPSVLLGLTGIASQIPSLFNKVDEVKTPSNVVADKIDLSAQRDEAIKFANAANRNAVNQLRGRASTVGELASAMSAVNTPLQSTLGNQLAQSFMNERNLNAENRLKADMFNSQRLDAVNALNAEIQTGNIASKNQILSNIAGDIQGIGAGLLNTQLTDSQINMLAAANPDFELVFNSPTGKLKKFKQQTITQKRRF